MFEVRRTRGGPDVIVRAEDGAAIPRDKDNADYVSFLLWEAAHGEAPRIPAPAPTAADVRIEASRRMQALFDARDAAHLAVVVSNAQRESARLYAVLLGIPGVVTARDWTADEASRAAQLHGADAAMEAIRAASNRLEPAPPADFTQDSHWPTIG